MRVALTGILVAVALTLQAQQPATAIVEGIVTEVGKTDPIPNVRVSFTPETGNPRTVTTDKDGKFSAMGLSPGRYKLTSTRTGFVKPRRSLGGVNLTLTAGEHLKDVRLQMVAAAVISGRVTDGNRQPLAGVMVEAHGYPGGGRQGRPIRGGGGQSDDRGEFRITGLAAGDYYVVAPHQPNSDHSTTYYPGIDSLERAVKVSVKSGAESGGIVFPLSTERHYVIRAKPAIPSSWPASRTVEFRLRPKNLSMEEPWVLFGMLPNGTFESRPVRGAFELSVLVSAENGRLYGSVPVEVADKDVNLGTIPLRLGFELRGRIATRDAQSDSFDFNRVSVTLFAAEGTPSNFAPNAALAKADGSFVIPSVATGKFRVAISGAPQNTYLEAVQFNNRAVDSVLAIDSEPRGMLELFVSRSSGTIQGIAQTATGKPVADATVVLVPSIPRRNDPALFKSASTDQYGTYGIQGIPPGQYSLLAWEDIDPGVWLIPDLLREFEGRAQRVTIDRGSEASHNVRVIPAAN